MASPSELRELWGPIGQIGYIVDGIEAAAVDGIEAAARQWTASIGIGPWQVFDPARFDRFHYHGEPSDADVAIALAFMGEVQIELIQQRNDAPSMYRDLIATFGEGAQHICFYPEDYDVALAAGLGAGMTLAQDGEIFGIEFAYLSGDGGRVIELARLSERRHEARRAAIADAATWDGDDPLRWR